MFGRIASAAVVLVLVCGMPVSNAIAEISRIYVNADCGDDAWTGRYSRCSGPDGYKRTIQAALDSIADGGTIMVMSGTYSGDGNRDLDFNGKAVQLTGYDCIIDCGGTPSEQHRAFHFHNAETENSIVQGFIITGGCASEGGAVLCTNSSPKFVNCAFEGNEATNDDTGGGAMYNENSSPTLEGCTFTENWVMRSASYGGGITNDRSSPTLRDCTFANNEAWAGGGIYNTDNSNPVLESCTFLNNQAARGAGIGNSGSSPTLSRCTFAGNSATDYGGGMRNTASSNPVLTHCIFTGNSARNGGAMSNGSSGPAIINCLFAGNAAVSHGGAVANDSSTTMFVNCTIYGNSGPSGGGVASYDYSEVTITNSILWDNTPNQIYNDDPACNEILFSCVEGGWDGTGNISGDPLFADADGPDNIPGTEDDDCSILSGSPGIDAGDNSAAPPTLLTDLAGLRRFSDDLQTPDTGSGLAPIIDMGAYEYQGLFYVDDTAAGADNGASWTDAFTSLQDALVAASAGAEIRIAQGFYAPDRRSGIATGDRDATFEFFSELTVRGGYAGFGAPNPDDRNINEYPTILTGDLAGNDTGGFDDPSREDNSLHVVTISETTENTILDGLTITAGNANGTSTISTEARGAGVYLSSYDGVATMIDCTITANHATGYGAGMFSSGTLAADRCKFIGNKAEWGGGLWNSAEWATPARLTNCLFSGNVATYSAGALATFNAAINCTNCTFSGNRAEGTEFYRGGAVAGDDDTDIWLTNCILWGNTDLDGAAESSQLSGDGYNNTEINYCCVQGWTGDLGGEGNFGNDPLFVDPDGEDNTAGTEDDNLRLSSGSPCIDSGDPEYVPEPGETDLDGYPRLVDHAVDVGAYENQGDIPEDGVIYVDDDAAGANNGSSWANAFNHLQDALAAASGEYEIRVAQGTYKPDQGAGITPYDREATFQLKNNVTIKGGYAGLGEPAPNTRDIEQYPTILTGDLAGDDGPDFANYSENSLHVVTGSNTDETPILDGVTITAGNADGGYPHHGGGGIDIDHAGRPTILNCTFSYNKAAYYGGGLQIRGSAGPILTQCTFIGNSADVGGGAVASMDGDNTVLTHCAFGANSAVTGGAISNETGMMTLLNCILTGNTAHHYSGGSAGAIYHRGLRSEQILEAVNCTIAGNSASGIGGPGQGGGLVVHSGVVVHDEIARIDNCIFWNNSDAGGQDESAQILDSGGESVLVNCCIQGFTGGGTNIADDPLLVNADGPDNIFGTEDDNLRLLAGSPCLDAGDNALVPESLTKDMDGEPRIENGVVDIGAYEGASPGIIISPQSLTVPEGGTATFTVALSTDPLGTIGVELTHYSGDEDIQIESIPALPFNSANYDQPQTVVLRAADDLDPVNGSALFHITADGYSTADLTATEIDSESSAILYVDDDAPSPGTGSSWASALPSLQDAVSTAVEYPQFNEIRVAQGTYKPDRGIGITPGSRDATFQLINNITFKGGYAGLTGPDPNARDITAYQTILSGDLDGNDIDLVEPADLLDEATRGENSRNVVTATNCNRTAVIDGFTITGGNANGPAETQKYGGGIYDGKPTVSNCIIIANSADIGGGGISFYYEGYVQGALLIDCTVAGNAAPSGGGVRGCAEIINCVINGNAATAYSAGGLYLGYACETTITDTVISNNSAATHGGGAYVGTSSDVVFTRCTFVGNSAVENAGVLSIDGCTCGSNVLFDSCIIIGNSTDGSGGAIYAYGYSFTSLSNCLLAGNSAAGDGGAICDGDSYDDGGSSILNCTFAHNTAAGYGGAIKFGGYTRRGRFLANSILWYNADSTGQTGASSQVTGGETESLTIEYCCIQNKTSGGVHIIDDNPLFIDADGPDDLAGNEDDNLRLEPDSPCINRGNNDHVPPDSNDLDGNSRILDKRVDMGAYEFSPSAEWTRYDIIDLGTLGGSRSEARAINNYRQIVGWAVNENGRERATLFDYTGAGNNFDLGTLGGNMSDAYSINIQGDVIGKALADATSYFHAALFDSADPCDNIGLEGPANDSSEAHSINDHGQIVGTVRYPNSDWKATLFDPSDPDNNIDLSGDLSNRAGSDDSCALSINNNGQIVGYAKTGATSVYDRPYMFDPTGAGNNIRLTPNNSAGVAYCINDAGQIVGSSWQTNGAALFHPGDPDLNLSLGALAEATGSVAYSINNRGQIVGSVKFFDNWRDYYNHAVIFDPTGSGNNRNLNDLIDNPLGWELNVAYGINDAGWIVGYGTNPHGLRRAFLLIPKGQEPTLRAHWKLDESEGDTAEDSAGDNDGTLHNDPLWLPNAGRVEGALLFDGDDDYVDCGDSSDFDITGQVTVAAWVNISAVNMDWQTVIAKGDSAWRLSTAEDEYRYHFAVTGGPPWNYINGDIEVEPGEWHHVCGTYDGADLRLYIDGAEDPAGPVPEAAGVTIDDFDVLIGENQERPGRYWDGMIDDVRIYNYALSAAEVSQFLAPTVIYVDSDAPGLNNGCCWADAFNCLQDALALAIEATEIRVAQGTYHPDCGEGITPGDREVTFQLKNGVTIKGGYTGHGEPEPNARNINQYPTIFSGDLLGNDVEVTNPCELPDEPTRAENSNHVVTASGTDHTAILDGVTITGGYARWNSGAGMCNNAGSPTLYNCTFAGNFAEYGGGMYNSDSASPVLTNCIFNGNAAFDEEGTAGGGMYNSESSPVLINCTFTRNWVSVGIPDHGGGDGGAIYNAHSSPILTGCTFSDNIALCGGGAIVNGYQSTPAITNCTFTGNAALGSWDSWGDGGAIYNDYGDPIVTNCTFVANMGLEGGAVHNSNAEPVFTNCIFSGNTARISGGAVHNRYLSNVTLTNCTFVENAAPDGSALACYAFRPEHFNNLQVTNCIIWDGESSIWKSDDSTITIIYSDVQYGWPGLGNIDVDPCFVSLGYWNSNGTPDDIDDDSWIDGDYHLKSFAWRWDVAREEWTFDRVTSRCIDAGNPGSPLLDEPLSVPDDPNNDYGRNLRINMGAYGGTVQASMPPYDWAILADINNDGIADFYDFACAGPCWALTAPEQPCDLDRSGDTGPSDLDLFADDWLKTTLWWE